MKQNVRLLSINSMPCRVLFVTRTTAKCEMNTNCRIVWKKTKSRFEYRTEFCAA